ncbi:MAG: hypothetical protein QXG65_00480 [Thermoplasmata archaeon]
MTSRSPPGPDPPGGFRIARDLPAGRHPLESVFPGIGSLPLAGQVEPDPVRRAALVAETAVQIVPADLWMYVAPREIPAHRAGWRPIVSPDQDCIVVGRSHLRHSPAIVLYMDIYHELCHVRQRRNGADLWPPGLGYVERPTEIEAYRVVIEEARRLGASDAFLQDYLKVEWIGPDEYRRLLETLGVPVPP